MKKYLILILILILLVAGGYLIIKNNSTPKKEKVAETKNENWQTYKNEQYDFTVLVPKETKATFQLADQTYYDYIADIFFENKIQDLRVTISRDQNSELPLAEALDKETAEVLKNLKPPYSHDGLPSQETLEKGTNNNLEFVKIATHAPADDSITYIYRKGGYRFSLSTPFDDESQGFIKFAKSFK